ncbi:MAG: retroviral-like aspartic protease family protein [Candidatus Binatia bacterium]
MVVAVALLLAGSASGQSRLYQWKDANGVVHFSNTAPPADAKVTVTTASREFRPVPLESDPARSQKLVRVALKGNHDTAEVPMIVDTGAQVTMIDQQTAERIGVQWLRDEMVTGVGGFGRVARVEVPSLRIGTAELRDVSVVVSPGRGLRLLGMDVIDRLDLTVGPDSLYRGR